MIDCEIKSLIIMDFICSDYTISVYNFRGTSGGVLNIFGRVGNMIAPFAALAVSSSLICQIRHVCSFVNKIIIFIIIITRTINIPVTMTIMLTITITSVIAITIIITSAITIIIAITIIDSYA